MKCMNCGFDIVANQRFCPECGAAAPSNGGPLSQTGPRKLSNLALFSVIGALFPIVSPIALICGLVAIQKCKRNPQLYGRGLALTGCILTGIEILVFVCFIIGGAITGQL